MDATAPSQESARVAALDRYAILDTEPEQAFDDLVAWIERGVRPQGDDVLASDLSRIGMKWTPVLDVDDPLAPRR